MWKQYATPKDTSSTPTPDENTANTRRQMPASLNSEADKNNENNSQKENDNIENQSNTQNNETDNRKDIKPNAKKHKSETPQNDIPLEELLEPAKIAIETEPGKYVLTFDEFKDFLEKRIWKLRTTRYI